MTCQQGIKEGVCRSYRGKCRECPCDDLEITSETYNVRFGVYKPRHCRATELPIYGKGDLLVIKRLGLYTKVRAEKERVKINTTTVVGWYEVKHGYLPLFGRKEIK